MLFLMSSVNLIVRIASQERKIPGTECFKYHRDMAITAYGVMESTIMVPFLRVKLTRLQRIAFVDLYTIVIKL